MTASGSAASPPAPGRRLPVAVGVAALVFLRLLVALAPAEPSPFGVPLGLLLELAVMAVATLHLWFVARLLMPPERRVGPPADPAGAGR